MWDIFESDKKEISSANVSDPIGMRNYSKKEWILVTNATISFDYVWMINFLLVPVKIVELFIQKLLTIHLNGDFTLVKMKNA